MSKFKRKTIEDILYIADGKTNSLLIKVRGRGWFKSTEENTDRHLTLTRLENWIVTDGDSFERVKVEHFHFCAKEGVR